MKTVTLGLVVVAVVVLAIGLASSGPRVDVDFIVGTWHQATVTAIAAIVAGLLLVCGLAAAVVAVLGQAADRRALEGELQRTYVRLREAEGRTQAHATSGGGGPSPPASAPVTIVAEATPPEGPPTSSPALAPDDAVPAVGTASAADAAAAAGAAPAGDTAPAPPATEPAGPTPVGGDDGS